MGRILRGRRILRKAKGDTPLCPLRCVPLNHQGVAPSPPEYRRRREKCESRQVKTALNENVLISMPSPLRGAASPLDPRHSGGEGWADEKQARVGQRFVKLDKLDPRLVNL